MRSVTSVGVGMRAIVEVTTGGSLPIAMHPKIVANSSGPGGWVAFKYKSTADPIKRNTAMIAVGYADFSVCLGSQERKRDTPASKYPPVKSTAGFGVVIISERARLASLSPRHDQLLFFESDNVTQQNSVTHAHARVAKKTIYTSRSNTETNGPWGGDRKQPA